LSSSSGVSCRSCSGSRSGLKVAQRVVVETREQRVQIHAVARRKLVHLADHLTADTEDLYVVGIEHRGLDQVNLVLEIDGLSVVGNGRDDGKMRFNDGLSRTSPLSPRRLPVSSGHKIPVSRCHARHPGG
jgi:hypothetical protein